MTMKPLPKRQSRIYTFLIQSIKADIRELKKRHEAAEYAGNDRNINGYRDGIKVLEVQLKEIQEQWNNATH